MTPRSLVAGGAAAAAAGGLAAVNAVAYVRAFAPRRWGAEAERGWTPADLDLDHEALAVRTADGVDLLAWLLPGRLNAAVVVSGGHRGRAGDVLGIAGALQRAGYTVAVFGWRGTPGSGPGWHTLGVLERRDLESVVVAVRRRLGDVPIGLLGFSLGGAVSVAVAGQDRDIAAVCTDSAFADPMALLGDGVRRVLHLPAALVTRPMSLTIRLRAGTSLADFRPLDMAARIPPRPYLIVHGSDDLSVPVSHARALRAATGGAAELWEAAGIGHVGAYYADRAGYTARVAAFFAAGLGVDSLL